MSNALGNRAILIAGVLAGFAVFSSATAQGQTHLLSSTAISPGARVDYSKLLNLLVIDKTGQTQGSFFNTYTIQPNGANAVCLTCGNPLVTAGHNGNPAWHPNGQYIVFQVQDTSLAILPTNWQTIAYRVTNPGYGTNNNLWLMTADGSQMWQLTYVAAGQGVLHAHFNPAGNLLVWANKINYTGPDQQWVINIANLVWTGGVPSLTNIKTYAPFGTNIFYETFGFSPDGSTIIFSAGSPSQQTLNVYTYNLTTRVLTNLTNTGTGIWNEHAHFSPDNARIIFGSSMNITMTRTYYVPFLDYWSMNTDGTNKVRLTYFNDPTAPEYYQFGLVTADFDFTTAPAAIFGSLEEVQANSSMLYLMSSMKFIY